MFYPAYKSNLEVILEKALQRHGSANQLFRTRSFENIPETRLRQRAEESWRAECDFPVFTALISPKAIQDYVSYFLSANHFNGIEMKPLTFADNLLLDDEDIDKIANIISEDENILRASQFFEVILGYYLSDLRTTLGRQYASLYDFVDTLIHETNKGNISSEFLPYLLALNTDSIRDFSRKISLRTGVKEMFDERVFTHEDGICPFGQRAIHVFKGNDDNNLLGLIHAAL